MKAGGYPVSEERALESRTMLHVASNAPVFASSFLGSHHCQGPGFSPGTIPARQTGCH